MEVKNLPNTNDEPVFTLFEKIQNIIKK